jgi:hypothetical protein
MNIFIEFIGKISCTRLFFLGIIKYYFRRVRYLFLLEKNKCLEKKTVKVIFCFVCTFKFCQMSTLKIIQRPKILYFFFHHRMS